MSFRGTAPGEPALHWPDLFKELPLDALILSDCKRNTAGMISAPANNKGAAVLHRLISLIKLGNHKAALRLLRGTMWEYVLRKKPQFFSPS